MQTVTPNIQNSQEPVNIRNTYSDNSLFVLAISEATASNFNRSLKNKAHGIRQEAIRNCEDGSFASFVCFMALATVPKRPVQSVYPVYGQFEYLNMINTTVNSPTENQHSPISIFWTNTKSYSSAEIFSPNHFVPVFSKTLYNEPNVQRT